MKYFADLDNLSIEPISDYNKGYIVAKDGRCVFDTPDEAFEYIKRASLKSLENKLAKLKKMISEYS